ncbi:DUF883 family protein [Flavimaricola marinus]|uniref:DUF883 domain-containing protein n=1 Tax=Flavimaricola marinus TaxID=1819565 RepID=A0A238LKR1_9RHOB|nr:DUF883 family protein [Flavimaricola marinus]SMY10279.1 hypothetical protein LOM8899_04454 [Flavimaricola marinus]
MARAQTTNGTSSTPDIDDLANQIATLKSDLAGLTEMMAEMGRSKKNQAQERIEETFSTARAAGAEKLAEARTRATHMSDDVGDFIHQQPATALGIAAGLGFLVGMIGTRK